MNRSHRRWLNEEIEIHGKPTPAAQDDYGLVPEGDWEQVYSAKASIQLMGQHEELDLREQQESRYVMVIEPPKYTKLDNEMRVHFRGRDGIIESVAYKHDTRGNLDRVSLVVREVESSGTEEI